MTRVAVIVVLAVCSAAFADLLGVTYNPNGENCVAYRINESTGALTRIGDVGYPNIEAVSGGPGGKIYASTSEGELSNSEGPVATLLEINPSSGEGTKVFPLGAAYYGSIAMSPSGDIYGNPWRYYNTYGPLRYIIKMSQQGAVQITCSALPGSSYPEFNRIMALEYGPDDVLYAWGDRAGLMRIDPATGKFSQPIKYGQYNAPPYLIESMAFTPDGRLLGYGRDGLYNINPLNGQVEVLHFRNFSDPDIRGIAWIPAPEPGTVFMVAAAFMMFSRRRHGHVRD